MKERLFVNLRYLKDYKLNIPMYINHNGVIKRYVPSPFAKKDAVKSGIWCTLEDLPGDIQEMVEDVSITQSDLIKYFKNVAKKTSIQSAYATQEKVKLHITGNTLLLPVVDNFLPYDGINAYTVIEKNGKPYLKEFLVGWDFHWSELYIGQTKYGNNVFCLAQDIPKEIQEKYADSFIKLSDALTYLENNQLEKDKTL